MDDLTTSRRALLSAAGAAVTGIAGCLGEGTDRQYEAGLYETVTISTDGPDLPEYRLELDGTDDTGEVRFAMDEADDAGHNPYRFTAGEGEHTPDDYPSSFPAFTVTSIHDDGWFHTVELRFDEPVNAYEDTI